MNKTIYKKLTRMFVAREKRLERIARELNREKITAAPIQFENLYTDIECRIKLADLPF